jgi:hypothetical protein
MLAYGLIDRIIERMPEAPHIVRPEAQD